MSDSNETTVISENNARFINRDTLSTTGNISTVSVEANNVNVLNAGSGSIEAEGTGISVSGQDALIRNQGNIDGDVNGVNFVNGGTSSGRIINNGTITSDSRAVNLGGNNVRLDNSGTILGTDNQRNGTVYTDATANNIFINNRSGGVIDAGEGNDGAGLALETGDENGEVIDAAILNNGTITGRGQAAPTGGTAGDGIRIFSTVENATSRGNIVNNGTITSESTQGTVGGIRVTNGTNLDGNIVNNGNGVISGANNGVYFGTGDHDSVIQNRGTISSDSRAINIDGNGVQLENRASILGTGDQRNGTVYADATADDYAIRNFRSGVIDAGEGNNGSAISLQTGDVDGDTVQATVFNSGTLTGRGDAVEGNGVGDGIRLFSGQEGVTFEGSITNRGNITASVDSDAATGISIEDGISLTGSVTNTGTISANEVAFDATEAGGRIDFRNTGTLNGDVNLSSGDDVFRGAPGTINGVIDAGAGDDIVQSGRGDDLLIGSLGNDSLNGDRGNDTVSFADIDVPVAVNLNSHAVDIETGFSVEVVDQPLASLTTQQSPADLVNEALSNNLYYNIHTNEFNGGEIRGQLLVSSDVTENGVRTITLNAELNAAQEPGPLSDSTATGTGQVTIVVDGETVTYSSSLSVDGIAPSDLLPVAGVSPIHLHNAPAGTNGPVITDIVQDAGGDTQGNALSADANTGDGDVFVEDILTVDGASAIRETGFSVEVVDQPLASLTTQQSAADLVSEAVNNNLYYNIHTTDFTGGEIRGQLLLQTDEVVDGVRTVTLAASLDSSQEPGPLSDSAATGEGFVTIRIDGENVTYSSSLEVSGIAQSDLLPVAGVSPIHLHNAPAGTNGPVITDIVQDAGGDRFGVALSDDANTGDGDVFNETVEQDSLFNIENITGSNDGDALVGNNQDNILEGSGGSDFLTGGGGRDTFVFTTQDSPSRDVISDFQNGEDRFDVSEFGFQNVSEIGVSQVGENTVLAFAEANTVTLTGIDASSIDEQDFLLV